MSKVPQPPIPETPNRQDDLFTSAEEQRAALLLAFLGTSPSPLMVRRVFTSQPSAARAALRLALAPLTGGAATGGSAASGGRTPAARRGAQAGAAAAADTTRRLEAWQPLEGLEGLEGLFRSAAGASALAVVLGLEARQDYAHGKELEAESVLAPLLGGLPCVLTLNEHLRVAQESVGLSSSSPGSSLGNQLAQQRADEVSEPSTGRCFLCVSCVPYTGNEVAAFLSANAFRLRRR